MGFHWWRPAPKDPDPVPLPPVRSNIGGVPFSVRNEAIEGERVWRVKPTITGLALTSINQPYEWDTTNTATCRPIIGPYRSMIPSQHDTPAPDVGCACGLYTILPGGSLNEWTGLTRGRVFATGRVALTGRVIRCTMGFKAEHAEILSPVVLKVSCASNPSCKNPVVTIDLQVADARGWCAQHEPGVGACVEVSAYMRETARQLSARYQREFTHEHTQP